MIRKILLLALKYEATRLSAAFDRLTRDPFRAREKTLLSKVIRNEDALFGQSTPERYTHCVPPPRREYGYQFAVSRGGRP